MTSSRTTSASSAPVAATREAAISLVKRKPAALHGWWLRKRLLDENGTLLHFAKGC